MRAKLSDMRVLRIAWLPVLALLAGCGSAAEREAAERQELEAALRDYLPRLAAAYAAQDAAPIQEVAAPKEVARVQKLIDDLAVSGQILEPTFVDLTLEKVNVWGYANAFVDTVEVWDLRSYSSGSHQLLSESLAQSNRVKYQFKREDGRWRVLFRTLAE